MSDERWHGIFMVAVVVVLLVGVSVLLPGNSLTGNVVVPACKGSSCLQLCDEATTCGTDEVCCKTNWASGVCANEASCDNINEYSLYQSLDSYKDTLDAPIEPVHADWQRFFFPLLVTLVLVGYFVWRRHDPHYGK